MSAAVEPPRGLVLLSAAWIAGSWLVSFGLKMPIQVSSGSLTPGVRAMLICCALGALVVWPMVRLCQSSPPAPVRSAMLDAATVIVLLQTVLWPLRLATTWAPERTLLIDVILVAHTLACAGVLAAARPWRSGIVRGAAMAACIAIAAGPAALLAAAGAPGVASAVPSWVGGGFPAMGEAMMATSSLPDPAAWAAAWRSLAAGAAIAACGAAACAIRGDAARGNARLQRPAGADTVART